MYIPLVSHAWGNVSRFPDGDNWNRWMQNKNQLCCAVERRRDRTNGASGKKKINGMNTESLDLMLDVLSPSSSCCCFVCMDGTML